jgi:hypothetical protein
MVRQHIIGPGLNDALTPSYSEFLFQSDGVVYAALF